MKNNCERTRRKPKKKYIKKLKFLTMKYGDEETRSMDELSGVERMKYGGTKIFQPECVLKDEDIKGPVIVCGAGEKIELSDDEYKFLSLGPKFSVLKSLTEEVFDASMEESLMKYKWDCIGDKGDDKKRELSDLALDVMVSMRR